MSKKTQKLPPKRMATPREVSVACALADADKALAVLFTMLQKVAPQGAVVADEVRANVRRAQKDFRGLVEELIRCRSRPIGLPNNQESVK
jgi:hypothetical protein